MFRTVASSLFALSLLVAVPLAAQQGFVPLFDGKTLDGWEVCNGVAKYEVVDGAIVGTTVEGSPNSFLCTKKEYGDFILEFETLVEPVLNSGVQIRSHRYAQDVTAMTFNGTRMVESKHKAGRFYGYQVEISNEASGTSGGVYDEARRGWLHNISSDPAARAAFKDNQWNRYRIAAEGDSIKVWVNDVPCADLVDAMDLSGYIGLQVHAFKGDKPAQVRWRSIRIKENGRHNWTRVWNGKNFDGWSTSGGTSWNIQDGAVQGISKPDDERIGYMISDRSFKDLTVRVQFKILKGNSGFFFRVKKDTLAGYEAEIDAEARTGGFWEVGGRRWVTGPENNAAVKAGDWNQMMVSAHGHRIVIQVNGTTTVHLPNDTVGSLAGHLAMQAHGAKRPSEVWFKDVEVLEKAK